MPVLKDAACIHCGTVSEVVWDGEQTNGPAKCARCQRRTAHQSCCNGGVKVITWGVEGIDLYDFVEVTGARAGFPNDPDNPSSKDMEPDTLSNGTPVHALPRFSDDTMKERHLMRRARRDRRKNGPKVQLNPAPLEAK